MLVKVCHGHFAGQPAQYLSLHNPDSANLLIDGQFAILPISWLEIPQGCHSFRSPTKSMRLPANLEGQIRAYAAILERESMGVVTAQESGSNPITVKVAANQKKSVVTASKKRRTSRSHKPSQVKSKIAL